MNNIYDYIKENRNMIEKDINVLDALVFSRLSYIHWENIIDKLPMTIKESSKHLDDIKTNSHDKKLIMLLKDNPRFKNISIIRCKYVLDKAIEEQFMAITIQLSQAIFISFRGTNRNVIGYKEDLNMSYMEIPSRIDALDYLNSEKWSKTIYIGGHSKGGNLAMYAAMNTNFFRRKAIKQVYNFDGPGFLKIDYKFQRMKNKILNYFPESSVIGRFLYNDAPINTIVSKKMGIKSHNIYNWGIESNDFLYGVLTKNSNNFHNACLHILENLAPDKRKIIVDYLYSIMTKSKVRNIKNLSIEDIRKMINHVPKITKEEKKEVIAFIKSFMKCLI